MLTLEKIKAHCKIETPEQDDLIRMYADAAIEAAEKLSTIRMKPGNVVDSFPNPDGAAFRLTAEPNGPVVALVYAANRGAPMQYMARVSNRIAFLPVLLSSACGAVMLEVHYRTGPCELGEGAIVDTRPLIELGIMKFVAYALMNRGDDPNDWAADSGAAQLWRTFKPITF